MKLPAEILTRAEIAALMDSFSTNTVAGKRNRAMVALIYGAEVKIGQLVVLGIRHYDEESGTLTVPRLASVPERMERLDPKTRACLVEWIESRKTLNVPGTAPLFCTVTRPRGRRIGTTSFRNVLERHRQNLGIQKRVRPEGIRQSRRAHRETEIGRFEATLAEYVRADDFRDRYPVPFEKWGDAQELLALAPDRYATTIGHLCREAVNAFSDALVRRYSVGDFETTKTKQKLRAVFAAEPHLSVTVRRTVESLVAYWEAVSDLANRQEHGAGLTSEDSRRLVFLAMMVMREVDLVLRPPPV
jgi:hypothetical protein